MDEVSTPLNNGRILTKTSRAGGPVTCVSLPRLDSVVWARGPYLHRHLQREEEQQLLVFPQGGTIHGIHYVDSNTKNFDAVVFGGRQLAFCNVLLKASGMNRLDVLQSSDSDCQRPHLTVSDWIWDVESFDSSSSSSNNEDLQKLSLVIGMARNMVEVWQVQSTTSLPLVTTRHRRIHGSLSCLVTSMHLLRRPNELWIAAGTAFHEIRVWSIDTDFNLDSSQSQSPTSQQHCLKGHAGIVHSVQFSSDGLSLASTSDDRSVRLWNYNSSQEEWSQRWVGWGHSARVWSVTLASEAVVSAGEDGTTRIWSLSSGDALASIQHSCSLWTVDCLGNSVVVGATDGTVAFYDLSTRVPGGRLMVIDAIPVPDDRPAETIMASSDDNTQMNIEESSSGGAAPPKKKKKKSAKKANSQVIVGLKWSERPDGSMRLVLATRAGSLMSLHVENQEWEQLQPWWEPSLQDSHKILAAEGCCMAVHGFWTAIGTTRGDVVLVSNSPDNNSRRIFLSARQLKSVQGLVWVNASTLVSFHVRTVAWWDFASEELQALEEPSFVLNMETKGVPMSCAYDEESRRMVVGDSRGNLALFHLEDRGNGTGSCSVEANSLLQRLHQNEHVTAISFQNNRIVSVGNDGCLHTSYINGKSLRKGWSIPASSMTGISQIWNVPSREKDSRFHVAGYYGNMFRLIDMFTGHEYFSIGTGGRQRIHDCVVHFPSKDCPSTSSPSQYGMVVCMNQKDGTNSLMIHRLSINKQEPELDSVPYKFQHGVSMHGETIFSACFFSLGRTQQSLFLLTGSEDCTSKISLYQTDKLIESVSLTPQESCVRAVCSSQFDESSALLVVGGGKLSLQFFLIGTTNEVEPSCIQDLEITYLGKGTTRLKATIDHRINAVKAVPLEGNSRSHLVVAGDSDGNCHLFVVSEDTQLRPAPGLILPTSSRPILCIELLHVDGRLLVMIGTTGGEVILFDLPGSALELHDQWDAIVGTCSPLSSYKAHQMGTNAISASIRPTTETEEGMVTSISICTGGDDQAICICDFSLKTQKQRKLILASDLCPRVTREASFSAIKGIFQFYDEGRRFLLTVGYSQQLALWQYSDNEGRELQLAGKISVDLGDVNCLAVSKSKSTHSKLRLAVGGLGVETLVLRKT